MIGNIVRSGWMNLRRDRAAWMLSFVVPIVFFSIFAAIFGARRSSTPRVTVAVVGEDGSAQAHRQPQDGAGASDGKPRGLD